MKGETTWRRFPSCLRKRSDDLTKISQPLKDWFLVGLFPLVFLSSRSHRERIIVNPIFVNHAIRHPDCNLERPQGFACLESVRKNTAGAAYRILVWDNASTDGTSAWLARQKNLTMFRSRRNLGISKAYNALLRQVRSPVGIRLDDDTLVPPHWIDMLLRPMSDASVALVGCKFVTPEGKLRAVEFMPPFFPAPLGEDGKQWQYTRTVEAVGGPCFAFRTKALRKIHGYSGALSDQHEDIDLCLRLRLRGFKVVSVNNLAVINKALNRRRWNYVEQNRKNFWKRWSGFSGFPRKDSHPMDRRYLLAVRLYREGKFRQVLKQLRPIANTPLREYGVQFIIALAYNALGDLRLARRAIRGLVRQHSRAGLLAESAWAMDEHCWPAAREAIKKGIRYFPNEPGFWFLRGQFKQSRGHSCGKDYDHALQRLPARPDVAHTDRVLGVPGILL